MGRSSALNEYDKSRIDELNNSGMSLIEIANSLDRSHTVVRNYLKDRSGYGKKKLCGRPSKFSMRTKKTFSKSNFQYRRVDK